MQLRHRRCRMLRVCLVSRDDCINDCLRVVQTVALECDPLAPQAEPPPKNEKLRNSLELRSFILVAGVGFEPTTFRLWA